MSFTFLLKSLLSRREAARSCLAAPEGHIVTVEPPTRSKLQNRKMWAMLHDIARARPEDRIMSPELWKCAFLSALGHEAVMYDGIDGHEPFTTGVSSRNLSVRQMADLITFIQEYGDRHQIRWSEPWPEYLEADILPKPRKRHEQTNI